MRILSESFGCSCRDSTGPNDFPHLYSSGTLKRGIRRHANKITPQDFIQSTSKIQKTYRYMTKPRAMLDQKTFGRFILFLVPLNCTSIWYKNPNLSTHYLTPQTQSATEVHIRGYRKPSLQNFTQHFYSQQIQMQACVEKHFTWKNVQLSGFNE